MQIFGTWGPSPGSEASEGQKAVLRLAFCLEGLDAGPLFEARCARLGRSGPGQGEWSLKSRQVGHFPTRVVPGKPIDPGSSRDDGPGWLGLGASGGMILACARARQSQLQANPKTALSLPSKSFNEDEWASP